MCGAWTTRQRPLRQPREAVADSWLSGQRVDGVVDLLRRRARLHEFHEAVARVARSGRGSRRGGREHCGSECATCYVPSWCGEGCGVLSVQGSSSVQLAEATATAAIRHCTQTVVLCCKRMTSCCLVHQRRCWHRQSAQNPCQARVLSQFSRRLHAIDAPRRRITT